MGIKCGLVGLPNRGKTSLFNYLTKSNAKVTDYPFGTIDPNIGYLDVIDPKVDYLFEKNKSKKKTYESIQIVDIAGLIEGAHKGEGLGNKFLENIKSVDLIIYVLRGFKDENIDYVLTKENINNEFEIIQSELLCYDLPQLCTNIPNYKLENKALDLPNFVKDIRFDKFNLLIKKPYIVVVNGNDYKIDNTDYFLFDVKNNIGDIEKFSQVCLNKLGYITFYTTGIKESRAWKCKKDSTVQIAAGSIHSDFAKDGVLIRTKLISYNDYINNKNHINVKNDHIIQEGDIVEFLTRNIKN